MALEGKAIKEEILDKDLYEANLIRAKDRESERRTPDSPESSRAIAPRSPISLKNHYNNLALQRNTNGSTSPIQKGGSTSPPHTSTASTPNLLSDSSKELAKLRKFFGALYQFGQDTSNECGDQIRSLVLSLVSGSLSTDEFKQALQESVNFPLRPYVLPFLKSHIPILKREVANSAKVSNQSILQFIRSNESSVFEFVHSLAENQSSDIFISTDNLASSANNGKNANDRPIQSINGSKRFLMKRRTSEGIYDHQNGPHDWPEYLIQSKRSHLMMNTAYANGHMFANYPGAFDYATAPPSHLESFSNTPEKNNNNSRDERENRTQNNGHNNASNTSTNHSDIHRSNSTGNTSSMAPTLSAPPLSTSNRLGGEEEWKNIHTMLNCISAMVDKTKRAITILQQRGIETTTVSNQSNQQYNNDSSIAEIKRQTEEKVAEFRRNAEEAVNQVKRQAVIEIQRAVAAAENRAIDAMAQERIKLEKMFADYHKSVAEENTERLSPPAQNTCWNCGRKANETCSGCNLARYCGSFCQHKDWEQHHQSCGASVRMDANGHKLTSTRNPTLKVPATQSTSPLAGQTQPQTTHVAQQSKSNSITAATVK